MIQGIVAHEIGHALGLAHNHYTATYPTDSLRSASWLRRMGYRPSVMGGISTHVNDVAQPEDHVPLDDLFPRVGPYDVFAIRWGYSPIGGARTPDDERGSLDRIVAAQDTVPWFRFVHELDPLKPAIIDDGDPVLAASLRVKNYARVMALARERCCDAGFSAQSLNDFYDGPVGIVSRWLQVMDSVRKTVGGFNHAVQGRGAAGRFVFPCRGVASKGGGSIPERTRIRGTGISFRRRDRDAPGAVGHGRPDPACAVGGALRAPRP